MPAPEEVQDPTIDRTALQGLLEDSPLLSRLRATLETYPPEAQEAMLAMARNALQQGRVAEARSLLMSIALVHPKNAAAFNGLGLTLKQEEDYELALAFFTRAMELAPDEVVFLYNRASTYMVMNKQLEAVQDLLKLAQKDPDGKTAHGKESLRILLALDEHLGNLARSEQASAGPRQKGAQEK
jgi:tetratricopeptide (TPR) repeat protein